MVKYCQWRLLAGLRQRGRQFARRIAATQPDHRAPLQQKLKRNPEWQVVADLCLMTNDRKASGNIVPIAELAGLRKRPFNIVLTGAMRLYRAASSNGKGRGRRVRDHPRSLLSLIQPLGTFAINLQGALKPYFSFPELPVVPLHVAP